MKKLLSSANAKITAVILFLVTCGIAIFSLAGIIVSQSEYAPYMDGTYYYIYSITSHWSAILVPIFVVSALVALALFIFLLAAAGRRKDVEGVQLNALNKIPLDLFVLGAFLLFLLLWWLAESTYNFTPAIALPFLFIVAVLAIGLALVVIMSCASRFKAGKWWRNTIIYKWLMKPFWRFLCWLGRTTAKIINNISILWKGIVAFVVFAIFAVTFCSMAAYGAFFGVFMLAALGLTVLFFICVFTLQLKTLKEGAIKMAAGNLDYRVDTRNMFHDLKEHGNNLNHISEGMAIAVEDKLKSERFKTELITNVSHDLKTPLTSLISYVDLLQKENIDNPRVSEYIEVLARQSARLKKLTEDLVEASKATTGNIPMQLANLEMNEFIRQIIGEYAEKFTAAGLETVASIPEEKLLVAADGRFIWRVFDNLLNNICKYSQPNTRVFIELQGNKDNVWVNLKNTSRDLLNISAENLRERFTRGDSSRSSEGSGLGLSIAGSLTELQKGKLELSVDGDLFKVKVNFDRIYD
jgi:signal transduction histidine kinase